MATRGIAMVLSRLERDHRRVSRKLATVDRLERQLAAAKTGCEALLAERTNLQEAIDHLKTAANLVPEKLSTSNEKPRPHLTRKANLDQLADMRKRRLTGGVVKSAPAPEPDAPEVIVPLRRKQAVKASPALSAVTDPLVDGAIENSHGERELMFSDASRRREVVNLLEKLGYTQAPNAARPRVGQYQTLQMGSMTYLVSWKEAAA